MKRYHALLVLLLFLTLSACFRPPEPDSFGRWFFGEGKEMIMDNLERQEASKAQTDQAQAILDRYEKTAPGEIAEAYRRHQALFLAITSGKNTATLLRLEQDFRGAHEKSLRSLGRMHEELEAAVGDKTWQAVSARMEQKMSRYVKR